MQNYDIYVFTGEKVDVQIEREELTENMDFTNDMYI